MTYLLAGIVGSLVGIAFDRWWGAYMADTTDDLRSCQRHSAASKAINPGRWD
jgi:hypothetical protein